VSNFKPQKPDFEAGNLETMSKLFLELSLVCDAAKTWRDLQHEAEIDRLRKLVADAAVREIEWAARLLEACDLFDFKESGTTGVAKSQRMRIKELRKRAEP
jgi:hypothetical protein